MRQTAALLEGLRALGAGHLLQDVLVLVLDAAIEVSGADRGFIMLATSGGQLEFTVGRGRGRISLEGQTFKISRKIPEDVFARGESRVVSDLVEDDAADAHMATVALGIRQVLCVPLKLMRFLDRPGAEPEPTRIGVLYLDSRESGTLQAEPARIGVETLAIEAAVAIENARLYRETVEKARRSGAADRGGDAEGAAASGAACRADLRDRGRVEIVAVDRRGLLRLHRAR